MGRTVRSPILEWKICKPLALRDVSTAPRHLGTPSFLQVLPQSSASPWHIHGNETALGSSQAQSQGEGRAWRGEPWSDTAPGQLGRAVGTRMGWGQARPPADAPGLGVSISSAWAGTAMAAALLGLLACKGPAQAGGHPRPAATRKTQMFYHVNIR